MVFDVSMLLFILSLALCGHIPAFAITREPIAKKLKTEPTKWPSFELSTLLLNFPEASKLLPTKEPFTLLPTTESSTLLPNTESSTSLPTTESSTLLPTTESSTLLPTTESSTLLPTTESSTSLPSTESSTLLPTTGFSTLLPTTESSTLLPTTESSTLLMTTESSTLLPTTGFSTLFTTTESSTLLPTTGFSTLLPTTESSTLVPTTESSTLLPTAESSTFLHTAESSTLQPTTESSTLLPTNKERTTLQPTSGSDANGEETTTVTLEAPAEEVSGKAVVAAETIKQEPKSESDYRRTVIFIKKTTDIGEGVFLRGGVNGKPIPIKHRSLDILERTPQRDAWVAGDNFLDWDDHPEANQTGRGDGGEAKGTPAQWTTNDSNRRYFHPLNIYGDNYWIVDVMMDCLKTDHGFFEFKGIMQDKTWEGGDDLAYLCQGMGSLPKTSINHLALCGKINIFFWGTGESCEVKDFP